jgi:hypothetical protein
VAAAVVTVWTEPYSGGTRTTRGTATLSTTYVDGAHKRFGLHRIHTAAEVGTTWDNFTVLASGSLIVSRGVSLLIGDLAVQGATSLAGALTVAGAVTLSGAVGITGYATLTGGLSLAGSASGYDAGELKFSATTNNGQNAITTFATGAAAMYFDHRATSNTGLWYWRNGTGAASTRMSLSAAGVLSLTIATGTAPLTIASTTVVTNLNADLLDGQHGAYYAPASTAITGSLTATYLPKASGGTTLVDSLVSESGTTVTVAGKLVVGTDPGNPVVDTALLRIGGSLNVSNTVFATVQGGGGGFQAFNFAGAGFISHHRAEGTIAAYTATASLADLGSYAWVVYDGAAWQTTALVSASSTEAAGVTFGSEIRFRNVLTGAAVLGTRWLVDGTGGHFVPGANNIYDVGLTATRPRVVYGYTFNASTAVVVGSPITGISWTGTIQNGGNYEGHGNIRNWIDAAGTCYQGWALGGAGGFQMARVNGAWDAQTAVLSGQDIAYFSWAGHNGTAAQTAVRISVDAAENFGATWGVNLRFATVLLGGATLATSG